MANEYTKRDKLIGITNWIGYVLSSPIRIFDNYPTEPVSNPFEDGINPGPFIEGAKNGRIDPKRSNQLSGLNKLV